MGKKLLALSPFVFFGGRGLWGLRWWLFDSWVGVGYLHWVCCRFGLPSIQAACCLVPQPSLTLKWVAGGHGGVVVRRSTDWYLGLALRGPFAVPARAQYV